MSESHKASSLLVDLSIQELEEQKKNPPDTSTEIIQGLIPLEKLQAIFENNKLW